MSPNRYPLDAPETAAKVRAWVLEGKHNRQIASLLAAQGITVSHQAVAAFRRRHAEKIDTLTSRVVARVDNVTIAHKEERVRRLAVMADRIETVIETRGIEATDRKWIGGLDGYEVEVKRIDAPAVLAWAKLARDIAEELGQMPKGDDLEKPTIWNQITVQIDARELHVTPEERRRRTIPSD